MNINIDEEIGTMQVAMEEKRVIGITSPTKKLPPRFASLKRKAVAVGCAAVFTMAATLAAATIQLYTCTRQLRVLDDLENAAGLLNALLQLQAGS